MPGTERPEQIELPEYEEVWTGDYIFENEWQPFRPTKSVRWNSLACVTSKHGWDGRWTCCNCGASRILDCGRASRRRLFMSEQSILQNEESRRTSGIPVI
jgi:hypothetical protein